MKNREPKLMKFLKFKTQIDDDAKRWFMSNLPEDNKTSWIKYYRKNEKEIKKELRKEYLEANPKIKEQYEKRKKQMRNLKVGLVTLGVTTLTILGGCIVNTKEDVPQRDSMQIEQEMKLQEGMQILKEQQKKEENTYEEFFDKAIEMKNTNERNEFITNQTKQIIVDYYNKEHIENPITVDRLETLILNENILQKTDRLGNCTYERVPQNIQFEQTENQKLVKIGEIYDFRIDGKTVAVFDANENVLADKNVESQDMSFQKTIELIKRSEELKDIYQYPSNDKERKIAQQNYEKVASKLLEQEKEFAQKKEEREKF